MGIKEDGYEDIQFTGRAGIIYTDSSNVKYSINSEMLGCTKKYDMVIFSSDIQYYEDHEKMMSQFEVIWDGNNETDGEIGYVKGIDKKFYRVPEAEKEKVIKRVLELCNSRGIRIELD